MCVCVSVCPRPNKCTTDLYLKTMSYVGFLQHSKEIERVAFAKNVPFDEFLVIEAKKAISTVRTTIAG